MSDADLAPGPMNSSANRSPARFDSLQKAVCFSSKRTPGARLVPNTLTQKCMRNKKSDEASADDSLKCG